MCYHLYSGHFRTSKTQLVNLNLHKESKINISSIHSPEWSLTASYSNILFQQKIHQVKQLKMSFNLASDVNSWLIKVIKICPVGTMSVHPILVEIFQSRPKSWTDRPTDWSTVIAVPAATPPARLKIVGKKELFEQWPWYSISPSHGHLTGNNSLVMAKRRRERERDAGNSEGAG